MSRPINYTGPKPSIPLIGVTIIVAPAGTKITFSDVEGSDTLQDGTLIGSGSVLYCTTGTYHEYIARYQDETIH